MSEKEAVPSKLWDVVKTLTDNAQQAGVRKAQELGFDLNAGEISFEEMLINLSNSRDVLLDAIEKGRIVQLPLKLQYRLLNEAAKVKAQLESLVNGTDAVATLESSVEDLNATIWQLNLQNLSGQVLAFDAKMIELKNQEAQIKKVLHDASQVAELLSSLQLQVEEAQDGVDRTLASASAAAEAEAKVSKALETSTEAEGRILGLAGVVQAHETSIAQASATTKEAAASLELAKTDAATQVDEIKTTKESHRVLRDEVQQLLAATEAGVTSAVGRLEAETLKVQTDLKEEVGTLVSSTKTSLDEQIATDTATMTGLASQVDGAVAELKAQAEVEENKRAANAKQQLTDSTASFDVALKSEVARYQGIFDAIEEQSNSRIKKNDEETKRLTKYLGELEARIHNSIERATGFTLFHAFQSRQDGLKRSTKWWAGALAVCVGASVLLSCWLIHSITTAPQYSPLFFLKLAISLPIIFAITFCSVQYSRERRLEEEYAFKSSISISLEPYRKLVWELINKDDPAEMAKYTDFLISSINRVFTSPTGQVFDSDGNGNTDAVGGLLKTAGGVAESLIKTKLK